MAGLCGTAEDRLFQVGFSLSPARDRFRSDSLGLVCGFRIGDELGYFLGRINSVTSRVLGVLLLKLGPGTFRVS
jgi:hypothetical protein